MKKVNFTTELRDLSNEIVLYNAKPMMLNELLADTLVKTKAIGSASRQLVIAMAVHGAKGEVDLEDQDFKIIQDVLKTADISTLLAGRLEQLLEKAEDKK